MNMEKLITRPLEKEINTISGIDESRPQACRASAPSTSNSTSTSPPLRHCGEDAVDKAKADPDFPTDLPADPSVMELNFSELMPVMNINLSGDYRLQDLKKCGIWKTRWKPCLKSAKSTSRASTSRWKSRSTTCAQKPCR